MDIDLVITWVDGSDPAWLKKKSQLRAPVYSGTITSNVRGRYRNIGELKYLLRSVELYCGFFRRIYLVVDDQIPSWLNIEHPRLYIVQHRDFISPEYLPTFSSPAIESCLHTIEGIADYFVSANDDIYFGRPISLDDLFMHKKIRVYSIGQEIPDRVPGPDLFENISANILAKTFLKEHFEYDCRYINAHTLKFVHTPDMWALEKQFPRIFEEVRGSPFRVFYTQSILATLYGHYLLATGRGVAVQDEEFFCMGNNDPDSDRKYEHLLKTKYYSVCINDTTDDLPDGLAVFQNQRDFYEQRFATPSSFER